MMDLSNMNIAGVNDFIGLIVMMAFIVIPNILEAYFKKQKKEAQRMRRNSQTESPSMTETGSVIEMANDEEYQDDEEYQEHEEYQEIVEVDDKIVVNREKSIQQLHQEKVEEREKAKKAHAEKVKQRNQEIQLARATEIMSRKTNPLAIESLSVIERGEINGEIFEDFSSKTKKSRRTNSKREKIDKRKLIIYSEIMKPKFAE